VSLLDEIAAAGTVRGPQCSVCRLISTLSAEDAADLHVALNDGRFTGAQIARALSKRYPDHKIAPMTLNRHKREHGHGTS
jgi:hypothetical protein